MMPKTALDVTILSVPVDEREAKIESLREFHRLADAHNVWDRLASARFPVPVTIVRDPMTRERIAAEHRILWAMQDCDVADATLADAVAADADDATIDALEDSAIAAREAEESAIGRLAPPVGLPTDALYWGERYNAAAWIIEDGGR